MYEGKYFAVVETYNHQNWANYEKSIIIIIINLLF